MSTTHYRDFTGIHRATNVFDIQDYRHLVANRRPARARRLRRCLGGAGLALILAGGGALIVHEIVSDPQTAIGNQAPTLVPGDAIGAEAGIIVHLTSGNLVGKGI